MKPDFSVFLATILELFKP